MFYLTLQELEVWLFKKGEARVLETSQSATWKSEPVNRRKDARPPNHRLFSRHVSYTVSLKISFSTAIYKFISFEFARKIGEVGNYAPSHQAYSLSLVSIMMQILSA